LAHGDAYGIDDSSANHARTQIPPPKCESEWEIIPALDFLLPPELVKQAWDYFRDVQTKEIHYRTFLEPNDKPAIGMNQEKMEKLYYDPTRYKTYLEQLGIQYPTVRVQP